MFLKEQNRKKWAIPITIGYFLTFVCFGFAGSAVGPLINRLSESTSANISALSYLFLFRSFGFIGSSLLLARLFDRFPGNRLLSFGLLFLGAMLALLGSTSVLWQLFLIMFILGISANFVNMGGNTLIQWLHKDNAGPFLNLVHVFYSIGCIITPLLIGSSLNSGQPIGRTLLILGFVVLPVALFLVFLPSPEIPFQRTDKNADQAQSQTHIWQVTLLIGLFTLFIVGVECTYNSWLSTFLFAGGIMKEADAAYFTSIFWTGSLVGRVLSAFASMKVKPAKLVSSSLILVLISSLGFVFFRKQQTIILIATLLTGFAVGPLFPNTLLLLKEKVILSGKMSGIVFAFSETGSMVIPWIIGQLFDRTGLNIFLYGIFSQLIIAIIFLVIIQKRFPGSLEKMGNEAQV